MTSLQPQQVLEMNEAKSSLIVESSTNGMPDVVSNTGNGPAALEVTNGITGTESEKMLQDCEVSVSGSDKTPFTPTKSNLRKRVKALSILKAPLTDFFLKDVKVNLGERINIPDIDSYVSNSRAAGIRCEICGKSFSKAQHLSRHARIHTGECPYACDICDRKFYRKDKLKIHLCIHKDKLQSSNNLKGKAQSPKRIYRRKLQSQKNLHKNKLQNQKCIPRSKLQSQKNLHKDKLPNQKNHYKGKLQSQKITQKRKPQNQKSLGKGKLQKQKRILIVKLQKQKPIHKGIAKLQKQKPIHKGIAKLQNQKPIHKDSCATTGIHCEVCGKNFAAKYHLARHTMIHTGERPFPCVLCEKKFYRKDKLDKHSLTHLRHKVPVMKKI